MAVGGVAVHPANPALIVIGKGEGTPTIDRIPGVGVLRATDGGLTWTATDLVRDPGDGHGFHVVRAGPNAVSTMFPTSHRATISPSAPVPMLPTTLPDEVVP